MGSGEYESATSLSTWIPENTPKAILKGSWDSVRVAFFVLYEFLNMVVQPENLQHLPSVLARLHQNSESLNGKFGFQVPTYHGTLRQDNSWTDSWENFFAHALQRSFDIEQSVNGTSSEIIGLCDSLFKSVIPNLLGPLQNQSRELKPCLNHGDLWSGNFALDLRTHRIIVFDACSFWGHNEYDLAEWGPSRSNFDHCLSETYHKWIPISPPENQIIDDMMYLIKRYCPESQV
ncbi:Ketosamine-3-kinase [Lachnellula willkommii]|uniref:protein-ribulosamine 3-kinase n=1 Tax=Lachnellula willkommii TaxID=215461 RepID=A0A559MJ59_9HELO|nr:Ketosamine-3-kinase [Lachnellula willkommii]